MSRINCHSSFKHYEMFHSKSCGGPSFGSVFNTTYNINCGGHNGGFWGGFGMGLGACFGNILGGFMGGFGGFGGFGLPSFGGGSWFGGGSSNRVSDSNCNCNGCNGNSKTKTTTKTKEVVKNDPDCAKISDITGKIKALPEDADEASIKGIISDIDDAIENLDDNNKDAQTKTLNDLKECLQKRLEALEKQTAPAVAPTTPATVATPAATSAAPATSAPVAAPVETVPAAEDLSNKINGVSNMNDLLGALPSGGYDDLSAADKDAFDKKFTDLLKGMNEDDRYDLLNNPKLPSALKAKVKQSFYQAGYSNYDGTTELKDGDVVRAHDHSGKTRDTKQASGKAGATITKSTSGNHPQTIVIHDRKDITYTYKETVDGEYIYTSDQDNQDYVLQNNGTGKFDLMEYRYHKGYGKRDWN